MFGFKAGRPTAAQEEIARLHAEDAALRANLAPQETGARARRRDLNARRTQRELQTDIFPNSVSFDRSRGDLGSSFNRLARMLERDAAIAAVEESDIKRSVQSIQEIADRTKQLALNAATAAVADEVRKRAERTANATGESADFVGHIQTGTRRVKEDITERDADEAWNVIEEGAAVTLGRQRLLGFACGPVADPAGHTDVVTDQQQVDDLIESLGF